LILLDKSVKNHLPSPTFLNIYKTIEEDLFLPISKKSDKFEIYFIPFCVLTVITSLIFLVTIPNVRGSDMENVNLWELANKKKDVLRFSTLFDAKNVRDLLSSEEGLNNAIEWCKKTAVTHVYVESYRDGYTAQLSTLEHAKKAFEDAGIDVSGCVTPTKVGKSSTGWKNIDCYTDIPTQKHLQEIFEYTAPIFDEIMIDDFLFTDCECDECKIARGDKTWVDYRSDLMVQVSRERILKPARAINPNVKIIIKYPQWYDDFHKRGYEVVRESHDYDKIWVGTETRDPDNERWGRKAQYEAYFIMRWLGVIGGDKTGGGWFDPYGTTPKTYVEQARQTVLADAKEALLFCYGSLLQDTGPGNVEKLRTEIPGLFQLAEIIRGKPIKGILAPKPPNSDPYNEQYIFDFIGMLGLPLVPYPEIKDTKAIFLSVHALKDPDLVSKIEKMMVSKTPVLITDGLVEQLKGKIELKGENIHILKVAGNPRSLLDMDRESLNEIRKTMLKPFGISFNAPNKVSLYLIGDNYVAIENFNDEIADVSFSMSRLNKFEPIVTLPVDSDIQLKLENDEVKISMSPRSMIICGLKTKD
jgi:hypothetical protein